MKPTVDEPTAICYGIFWIDGKQIERIIFGNDLNCNMIVRNSRKKTQTKTNIAYNKHISKLIKVWFGQQIVNLKFSDWILIRLKTLKRRMNFLT